MADWGDAEGAEQEAITKLERAIDKRGSMSRAIQKYLKSGRNKTDYIDLLHTANVMASRDERRAVIIYGLSVMNLAGYYQCRLCEHELGTGHAPSCQLKTEG